MRHEEKTTKAPTTGMMKAPAEDVPMFNRAGFPAPFAPAPFGLMRRFANDMERMLEDFGAFPLAPFFDRDFAFPQPTEFQRTMWAPKIEVIENGKKFKVRAELPGLNKEDVSLELNNNFLILKGERKQEEEEKREGFYRSERNYGSFYRSIPIPEGAEMKNPKATFVNGLLEVEMEIPASMTKNKKVEISTTPMAHTKAAGK